MQIVSILGTWKIKFLFILKIAECRHREARGPRDAAGQDGTASSGKSKLVLELNSTEVGQNPHARPKQGKSLLKQKF